MDKVTTSHKHGPGIAPNVRESAIFSKMTPTFIECTLIIALMAFKLLPQQASVHPEKYIELQTIFIRACL